MTEIAPDGRLHEPSGDRAPDVLFEHDQEECPVHLQRIIDTQQEIAAADLDLQSVMDLICERTQELTGADGASILFLEDGRLVHRAGTGFAQAVVGKSVSLEGTFTGMVYTEGRSGVCNDTAALSSPLARDRGINSLIAVPLRHGDATVGIVTVLSQARGAFSAQDLGTLELLSVVLSAAVSHAAELDARRAQVEALARFRTVFDGASIGIVCCDR